jgi:hypothetical protein
MRSMTIAIGFSIFCTIAPAKAKIDHSKCEERCRAYYCHGGISRQFSCNHECHSKCASNGQNETSNAK